ncbi:MAG: carboxypeptidase regulatory-like domain-containing protein, partial [Gemmatimonadota bacterium]|nr:carboxypeptidase regulatory-like domain-containing protein [Gemmatimonadota bacterium]
ITVMRIELSALVATRSREITRSAAKPIVISGVVTDSMTGNPVADARVSLLGTLAEGVTDRDGQFVIAGAAQGAYTVEVSTPELDSIGAVKRTPLVLGDASVFLQLYLPSTAQITASVCGAANLGGVVIGRILPPVDASIPPNTRIVAEWLELHDSVALPSGSVDNVARGISPPSTVVRWLTARADSRGTYRLCGVPTGTPLVLRTEVDSGSSASALPVNVKIADDRRFARADLVMTSDVNPNAVFTGFVVSDSTQVPVVDAEVLLTDLSRSVFTNAIGGFRFNDIPAGTHKVLIRRVGFSPVTAQVAFVANQTVQHRVALSRAVTLAAVEVVAATVPAEFEEHRKLGLGRFITREQIAKSEGRQMEDLLRQVAGVQIASARGGQSYIVGRRAPASISTGSIVCGAIPVSGVPETRCTAEKFTQEGLYCPTSAEALSGIFCACYSQVYIDGRLMNAGRPTEPFNVNSVVLSQTGGIEWYATAAQTPGRYSALNARCGVMLIWTRRST